MKKLLSILCASAIGFTSLTATACSFAKDQERAVKASLGELVDFASLIAKAGILNDAEGVDASYVFNYYGSQPIGNVFDKYKSKTDATIANNYQTLFNTSNMNELMNKTIFSQLKDGGTTPTINSFSDIQSYISMVTTMLSNGFEPNVAKEVVSIIGSGLLDGAINSVLNIIRSPDQPLFTNYRFAGKDYNMFTGLAHAFDQSAFNAMTNQEAINSSVVDVYNFLLCLTKPNDNPQSKVNLDDEPSYLDDTVVINDASHLYKQFNALLGEIVDGSRPISGGIFQKLLSYYGIPSIIRFLGIFTNYINAFDNAANGGSLVHKNATIKDGNHLFSNNLNNKEYKTQVLKKQFDTQRGLLNWQVLARNFSLLLGVDDKNDPHGYNLKKLLSILFENGDSNHAGYNNFFDNAINTVLTKINIGNSTVNMILKLVPGIFNQQPVEYLLTPLSNTTSYTDNGLIAKIDEILKLVQNFIDVSPVQQFIDKNAHTYFDNPFATIYQSNDFLANLETSLLKIAPSIKTTFDKIVTLKNLHNIMLQPIGKTVKVFSDNPLPQFAYFLNDMSSTQLFGAFAELMGIDIKRDQQYRTTAQLNSQPKYVMYLPYVSDFFAQLGMNAQDALAKAPDTDRFAYHGSDPVLKNQTGYPCAIYGLFILKSPNLPKAGINGILSLMGYNNSDIAHYRTGSAFEFLQKIYNNVSTDPNDKTVPNGIQALFALIKGCVDLIGKGIQQDEKDNFLPYFAAQNWTISNINEKITNDPTQIGYQHHEITFNIAYHNKNDKINRLYRVTLDSDDSNNGNFYRFSKMVFVK